MLQRKFESHLTAHIKNADKIEALCNNGPFLGLKFSKIDGDALMDSKPYCYITSYDTDGRRLLATMEEVRDYLALPELQVETLRIKIEEILYDTKTQHDLLTKESEVMK